MVMSKRVYIALFAVLTELVAIAATGNKGVTDFVAHHMATSPLGDLFLRSVPSFPWSVTSDGHPTTYLVAQWAAIATFVVVFSVLTQGLTILPLIKRLGLLPEMPAQST